MKEQIIKELITIVLKKVIPGRCRYGFPAVHNGQKTDAIGCTKKRKAAPRFQNYYESPNPFSRKPELIAKA